MKTFLKGEKICSQGSQGIYVFVIVYGRVGEFATGQMFGEEIFFEKGTEYKNTMVADEKTYLLCLNEEGYEILIKDYVKRGKDDMTKFLFTNLPGLEQNYSPTQVLHNLEIFERTSFSQQKVIFKEGEIVNL
jgi:CRP-like cAMP-binding protein